MTEKRTWHSREHNKVENMAQQRIWQSREHGTVENMTEQRTYHSEEHGIVENMAQHTVYHVTVENQEGDRVNRDNNGEKVSHNIEGESFF